MCACLEMGESSLRSEKSKKNHTHIPTNQICLDFCPPGHPFPRPYPTPSRRPTMRMPNNYLSKLFSELCKLFENLATWREGMGGGCPPFRCVKFWKTRKTNKTNHFLILLIINILYLLSFLSSNTNPLAAWREGMGGGCIIDCCFVVVQLCWLFD